MRPSGRIDQLPGDAHLVRHERFESELDDIFELRAEIERAKRKPTKSLAVRR
jgi:hypothetical protein